MLGKKSSVFQKVFLALLLCVLFAGPVFAAISDSDFFDLCAEGSLEQVVDAVNDGADVNAKGYGGRTPLMIAAAYNPDPEVVKFLIEAGADVSARTDEGWSAEGGLTPLMVAAGNCDPDAIRALIDAGSDVNARNRAGWSPLLLTAGNEKSNPEALRVLIEAGADVNAHDGEGNTPLLLAAERCLHPEVIEVLLDSGALPAKRRIVVPNRGDNVILLAIDFASRNPYLQNTEVLKRLEEETERAKLDEERALELVELCQTGSLQEVGDAIKNGVDVNARLEHERTPLMLAAWETTDPEVIKLLIGAGADVHARDELEYTPLMCAANFNSNPQVIEALIEAGADVNVVATGLTPLMVAAISCYNPEVIVTLLELGADPKVQNKNDRDNMAIDYARSNYNLKNTDALKKLEELSVKN